MEKIKGMVTQGKVYSNSELAMQLFEKQRFGEKSGEKISYMNEEAFYLFEQKKMDLFDSNFKKLQKDAIVKLFVRGDKRFMVKYEVFCDLRTKGFTPKSALKFGSDFRVYEKGKDIGKAHAKWICFCLSENKQIKPQEFSAQNRVAHSTNKKLLLAIVDSEDDVSYYECSWRKVT